MSGNFSLTIDDDFFSDYTDKSKYDSVFLTNSILGSNEAFLSINNSTNYLCHNLMINATQNKKERTPLSFNLMNQSNKEQYNKSIILHLLKNNKNTNSFFKINNKDIKRIILQSSSLKKNETIKKSNKENNNNNENNYSNINIKTNNNSNICNNKVFNSKNIIRVILSNEKAIKNFPMEYLNEMMCDLCTNLYNYECNYEKIKTSQNNLYNQQHGFFDKRISSFNFLLHLTLNTCIKEATIFLAFVIFDRYASKQPITKDELIIAIISFAIAIKYMESNVPNLNELYNLCRLKSSKEQIKKYELDIMEKLNYNISIPTIFDLFQFIKVIKNMNLRDYNLGLFILEMFYISGAALKYNALVVIEAIYLIILEINAKENKYLNLYSYMTDKDINIMKYNEEIKKCLVEIKNECIHIKEKNYVNLVKKFASEKYQKISVDFQLL